jgi:hypothetical protein
MHFVFYRVIEKLIIHSDEKKAEALKILTDEFLVSPVFEGKKDGKVFTLDLFLHILVKLYWRPEYQSNSFPLNST